MEGAEIVDELRHLGPRSDTFSQCYRCSDCAGDTALY